MEKKMASFWIMLYLIPIALCLVLPIAVTYSDNGGGQYNEVDPPEYLFTKAKTIEVDYHIGLFTLRLSSNTLAGPIWFYLGADDETVAYPLTRNVTFSQSDAVIPKVIHVFGNKVGSTKIKVTNCSARIKTSEKFNEVKVIIVHSLLLKSVNVIIGWMYFLAWSVSFYPQVYINFKRKSVIGLNFDFLAYNITGFIAYSVYNGGMFFSKEIQEQYFKIFPGTVIPVLPNDVFFAFHAVLLTTVTIIQCFLYDRGGQTVSNVAKVLLALMWAFVIFSFIPAVMGKVSWMMYLNFFSYVKLAVTLIKYIPQAYMNYQRKSTVGWSIGNVLLDFTGGSLSLMQMFFISYNNDQWNSIFGDFTKFGLGLFSIFFDVLFMTQHYVLYHNSETLLSVEEEDEAFHGLENPHVEG